MRRYRDTLILVVVVLLVGGGIAFMQQGGAGSYGGNSMMRDTVHQLEQIGRYAHDYLNGYLSGSGWGTVLPQDYMQEEMKHLQIQYEMAVEMVTNLYPLDHRLEPLFSQFAYGFERALTGLESNDIDMLLQAHSVFHQIDYGAFYHDRRDDLAI